MVQKNASYIIKVCQTLKSFMDITISVATKSTQIIIGNKPVDRTLLSSLSFPYGVHPLRMTTSSSSYEEEKTMCR